MIFILHFAATFFMLGLSWFVQLVHYPLLGEITQYRKRAYDDTPMRLATWVVAPPMIVELITGTALAWRPVVAYPPLMAWIGLALLLIIWFSTAFLQAPRHEVLATQFMEPTHRSLMRTNLLRTFAWTLRGALLLYALLLSFSLVSAT